MRLLLGSMVVVFAGCNCGFEAVEECAEYPCPPPGVRSDAGRPDGGQPDAGRPDAGGVDGGVPDSGRPDASSAFDAGLDAGRADAGPPDAGAPDSGSSGDGGCLDDLRLRALMQGDFVRVIGAAGTHGAVDFIIGGYSAGASSIDGIQRFTNDSYLDVGIPSGVSDTGLWMWTGDRTAVVPGRTYLANNESQYFGNDAFINFRVLPGAVCQSGAGQGWFVFSTFTPPPGPMNLVEGDFEFHCPDAGIAVNGCFIYGR